MDNVTSRFMLHHAHFIISYRENLGEYKLVFLGLKILQAQHPGLEKLGFSSSGTIFNPCIFMAGDKNFNIKRACRINVS